MRRFSISFVLGVMLIATTAQAADFGIGLRAGTHGYGAEAAVGINERVAIRGGFYDATISDEFSEADIDYDGELTLGGTGALVDFFPMRGTFRLSAGWFSNRNEIGLTATVVDTIEIGDSTYTAAEVGSLIGKLEVDSSAPYFGIGWGNVARGKRVGFLFDLGLLRQGAANVTLGATNPSISQALEDDLAREEVEIEDEIEDYEYWPVISFGIAIRL